MTKLFVKLTTGANRIDNSMGYNTYKFDTDPHPTFVRPHLIESVQRKNWCGSHGYTQVLVNGTEYALHVLETPEQIMEQIEAIECPQLEDLLSTEPPPIMFAQCSHKNFVPGNHGSRGHCPDCGWQGWLDDAD